MGGRLMDTVERFVNAQEESYGQTLTKIKSGQKRSHWMWHVFPQFKGLGRSETARYYGGTANVNYVFD
ncbi:DUF1810 family protein [Acetobacterium malicum]|uniref:DUF1810 family protein n=2 Tax=Acetobacterium malicum TaxID=52692 RepID=A0ABR6YZJ5_9FIRM|nr:DUF1810 family protein [Acetobacterium malicum]